MTSRHVKGEALSEEVREWYRRAERDLAKARDDLERGWYPEGCFYAQQACEKILKAYPRTVGVVVRSHRIEALLLAKGQGLQVDDLLENRGLLEELSEQYLAPRYPNFRGGR